VAFVDFPEKDLSRGMDRRNGEDQLQPGYSDKLLNAKLVGKGSTARAVKREGYKGFGGYVPLRVSELEYDQTNNKMIFTFDGSIDLSNIADTPLVVYGKTQLNSHGGDFNSTNAGNWYSTFVNQQRYVWTVGSGTTTVETGDRPFSSNIFITGIASSSSETDKSNELVTPDVIRLDQATEDLNIDYTTAEEQQVYIYFKEKASSAGSVYINSALAVGTGTNTYTIASGTHGLSSTNIGVDVFADDSGEWIQIVPDQVTVNTSTGSVAITFSGVVTGFNARAILSNLDADNSKSSAVSAYTSTTFELTDVSSPFNFVYVYQTSGSTRTLVLPDSITYDAETEILSVTVNNGSGSSVPFTVFYQAGEIQANKLSITPDTSITNDGTDTSPQLCVYGIPHTTSVYGEKTSREGWVTHIDSYKRQGENKIVAGLGGNLFSSVSYLDSLAAYQFGADLVSLSGRTDGDRVIGPVFYDTGFAAARTGGYITCDSAGSNVVQVTAAEYNASTEWVEFTLDLPNMAIKDSAGSSTTIGSVITTNDYVTITGMGYDRMNGTWQVQAVASGSDTLTISVSIPEVTSSDYDHSDAGGLAGIFTDKLVLDSGAGFEADDTISSDYFSDLVVTDLDSTDLYFKYCTELMSVPSGLTISGVRTSDTIPVNDVDGFVAGDMITYGSSDYRVLSVSADDDSLTLDQEIEFEHGETVYVSDRFIPIEGPSGFKTHYFTAEDYVDQPIIRSTMVKDSLFCVNGEDSVIKYDGSYNYRAGLFRWQPGLFIAVDSDAAGLSVPAYEYASSGIDTTKNEITFTTSGEVENFSVGDRIYHAGLNQYLTVKAVNTSTQSVSIIEPLSASGASTVFAVRTYRYYYRLEAIDLNGNVVASAVTGLDDHKIELHTSGYIRHKMIGFPNWDTYDYDHIKLKIYRTRSTSQTLFKLIDNVNLSTSALSGYVTYTDTVSDDVWDFLPNDDVNDALLGTASRGTGWEQPYIAKCITSANNRLILGNVKSYPYIDIQAIGSAANTLSNYNGLIWTVCKSDLNIGTSTDMINTVRYKMITSGSSSIASYDVSNSSQFSFTYAGDLTASIQAGSWVYLFHDTVTDGDLLDLAGWWQVKTCTVSLGVTTITVTYTHGLGASTSQPDKFVYATNKDVPVWLGTDGNRHQTTGNSSLVKYLAMARLADAVNVSMRCVNTALSGYTSFEPWVIAHGGGDLSAGQIKLEQPKNLENTFALKLPAFTGFNVFVNQINQAASTTISSVQDVFPSRLLVSYPNYPEIFDRPNSALPEQSDSVIDVNSADGQELTTAVPFFGDSAFGSASQSGVIAVFKANSIYVVDTNRKAQGLVAGDSNPVQQIDSNGLGCTVPGSVTVTKQGIMFANQNGIYRLTRSLTIEWVGEYMDREYKTAYKNRLFPEIATATHYAVGSQYKLSYPVESTDLDNSQVFVYDHSLSGQDREGSWTYYDNHPATGWANLNGRSYFGTTDGRICVIRDSGSVYDYADEADGINYDWISRAIDFGQAGIQKVVAAAFLNFRTPATSAGTTVQYALDTSSEFKDSDSLTIREEETSDSISDQEAFAVQSIRVDFRRARCQYIQLRVTNSTVNEPIELTGVNFKVQGTTSAFTKTARQTVNSD
jgi:hypothetical protein